MYEHLTDRAKRVMQVANAEAKRLDHEFIGTTEILLGLLRDPHCRASHILRLLNVDPVVLHSELLALIRKKDFPSTKDTSSPIAKTVVEQATREVRDSRQKLAGTEHLLLELLVLQDTVAYIVLTKYGINLENVRGIVVHLDKAEK